MEPATSPRITPSATGTYHFPSFIFSPSSTFSGPVSSLIDLSLIPSGFQPRNKRIPAKPITDPPQTAPATAASDSPKIPLLPWSVSRDPHPQRPFNTLSHGVLPLPPPLSVIGSPSPSNHHFIGINVSIFTYGSDRCGFFVEQKPLDNPQPVIRLNFSPFSFRLDSFFLHL